MPWREAVDIAIQIARALGKAHSMGYVHRDVKPENILLFEDGRARLTDFGIVKDISSLRGFLVKGKTIGTAAYASPEQCLGKRLDSATDMYSLGATLFSMVCGRPPFTGDDHTIVMKKHVKTPVVAPIRFVPDIPKPLSNVIEKMLAKRQTDRYESMERLVEDLEKIERGKVAIGSARPRVARKGEKPPKRRRRAEEEEPKERKKMSPEALIVICLIAVLSVFLLVMS